MTDPTLDEPWFGRASEVRALLLEDDTLLGRIYRYELEGKDPKEIADLEGNATVGFVYSYRAQIRALIDGEIPNSANIAKQTERRVKKWLKTKELTEDLRAVLNSLSVSLASKAEDVVTQLEEAEDAVEASIKAEADKTPGVYVYTLPHYRLHRVDPETGRTYLKVGHSATDAYYRADSSKRLTALPEDPILLRIYPAEQSAEVEKVFHDWLKAADHLGIRTGRVGREWFLTSIKFLDRIAKSNQLEVREVNSFDDVDE